MGFQSSITVVKSRYVLLVLAVLTASLAVNLAWSFYWTTYGKVMPTDIQSGLRSHMTLNVVEYNVDSKSMDEPCQDHFNYVNEIIQPAIPSNYSQWSFRDKHKCPHLPKASNTTTRRKVILSCKDGRPRLFTVMTSSSSDVMSVPHNDPCLKAYIQTCCRGDKVVPNVVNFVYANYTRDVTFYQFLSYMGALRFSKPCLFLFHGNLPHGRYWDLFLTLAPNVIHVNRTTVSEVFGQKLKFVEHYADVMRIEALIAFGGYYLDWDQLLVRSVDDLRNYRCTLSHEIPGYFVIGFIMAEMNATFLHLWHEGYRKYDPSWNHNSLRVPFLISEEHPEVIHIAGYKFATPNYMKLDSMFDKNYNWTESYGIHLYIRFYNKPANETIVRTLNTTIGALSRNILFGDKELCIE